MWVRFCMCTLPILTTFVRLVGEPPAREVPGGYSVVILVM